MKYRISIDIEVEGELKEDVSDLVCDAYVYDEKFEGTVLKTSLEKI